MVVPSQVIGSGLAVPMSMHDTQSRIHADEFTQVLVNSIATWVLPLAVGHQEMAGAARILHDRHENFIQLAATPEPGRTTMMH